MWKSNLELMVIYNQSSRSRNSVYFSTICIFKYWFVICHSLYFPYPHIIYLCICIPIIVCVYDYTNLYIFQFVHKFVILTFQIRSIICFVISPHSYYTYTHTIFILPSIYPSIYPFVQPTIRSTTTPIYVFML